MKQFVSKLVVLALMAIGAVAEDSLAWQHIFYSCTVFDETQGTQKERNAKFAKCKKWLEDNNATIDDLTLAIMFGEQDEKLMRKYQESEVKFAKKLADYKYKGKYDTKSLAKEYRDESMKLMRELSFEEMFVAQGYINNEDLSELVTLSDSVKEPFLEFIDKTLVKITEPALIAYKNDKDGKSLDQLVGEYMDDLIALAEKQGERCLQTKCKAYQSVEDCAIRRGIDTLMAFYFECSSEAMDRLKFDK